MMHTCEFESVLEVQNDFHSPKSIIKLLNFDQVHRTLGYFVCPSGNQSETVKQLTSLARKWVNRVQQSTLKDYEILLAYESVLLRQWAYRLPGSRLTFQECDSIMKIVTPTLLNAMHTQRNMSRFLLQAGDVYCGMGFQHLYDLAAEEKMKFLKMNIHRNDTTGKLMRISMQVSQLQIGTEQAFYNLPYDTNVHLETNTWFLGRWQYCDSRLLQMDLAMDVTFKKQRENDVFLMDLLVTKFSASELEKLNRVRMHLQLLTLADVTSLNGRRLLQDIKKGISHRNSKLCWPKQPLVHSWLPLRSKACLIFQHQLSRKNLWEWICSHQKSKWLINQDASLLTDGESVYRKCDLYGGKLYTKSHDDVIHDMNIPADATIVKGRPYLCDSGHIFYKNYQSKFVPTDFEEIFPGLCFEDEIGERLNHAFLDDDVVVATDGSVKKDLEQEPSAYQLEQERFYMNTIFQSQGSLMTFTQPELKCLLYWRFLSS